MPQDLESPHPQVGRTEQRAQDRAREKAEAAEWDRLSAIYFAHMRVIEPGVLHCFCGSLDELREAVARLQTPHRSPEHRQASRDLNPTDAARAAVTRAQVRAGSATAADADLSHRTPLPAGDDHAHRRDGYSAGDVAEDV